MLSTFLLTMRGTPFYYNGDELGMTNAGFNKITDYRDMSILNEYQYKKNHGADMDAFMKDIQFGSRDNGRTPFQWNSSAYAGFSQSAPWININPNYKLINQESQEKDPASVLNFFRKLTRLRQSNPVWVYGKYQLLDRANPDVYAFAREWNGKKMLVLLNFTNHPASAKTGIKLSNAKMILNNYSHASSGENLQPYEAAVYELK